jgi:hypothetical protein
VHISRCSLDFLYIYLLFSFYFLQDLGGEEGYDGAIVCEDRSGENDANKGEEEAEHQRAEVAAVHQRALDHLRAQLLPEAVSLRLVRERHVNLFSVFSECGEFL